MRQRSPGLPIKKLHKLLYYAQGHHLAVFGLPLFHESVSAWDMGPVVGSLWYEERQGHPPGDARKLDEAALNTVGYVLSRYGRLTGQDLENLSHAEEPWRLADRQRTPGQSVRIERAWLSEFFSSESDEDDIVLDAVDVHSWLAGARERSARPARRDDLHSLRARIVGD
jgi:uncharacterized phage-associated protein